MAIVLMVVTPIVSGSSARRFRPGPLPLPSVHEFQKRARGAPRWRGPATLWQCAGGLTALQG